MSARFAVGLMDGVPLREAKPESADLTEDAFARFEAPGFLKMLEKHEARRDLCRFVAAPDVVGCAQRTVECFHYWQPRLAKWPVAFVCQDGQENLQIPWDNCAAVFIGGSTEWKMGKHAAAIVKASKVIGKWCHVGRINTPGRLEYFQELGGGLLRRDRAGSILAHEKGNL